MTYFYDSFQTITDKKVGRKLFITNHLTRVIRRSRKVNHRHDYCVRDISIRPISINDVLSEIQRPRNN